MNKSSSPNVVFILPIRTGNCSVPLPGQGHYGLAPWEFTLGHLFSDAGYATAAFGKWHVGDIDGRLPTDQGFDEWFGIKNTSDESAYGPIDRQATDAIRSAAFSNAIGRLLDPYGCAPPSTRRSAA